MPYPYVFITLTLILVLLLLVVVFGLHKIRHIHLATYAMREDLAASRREIETLFSQTQALMALERKLSLPDSLPPMRGWAGSPDFLLRLADEVLQHQPRTVMECSSGVSTIVVARCLQLNGVGHVYSLEHNSAFAEKTRQFLIHYGLSEWATVLDAPLKAIDGQTSWYSEEAIPANLPPVDVLVVDGPPAHNAPLARMPALPRLLPRMAEKYTVILDDAGRPGEQQIISSWMKSQPRLRKETVACEKGMVLLHADA